VHHLVLRAFVGRRPLGAEACHANGIRTDNNLRNLRWGSRAENVADARKHGTIARGARSGASKLTDVIVLSIRAAYIRNVFGKKRLAKHFGVSEGTVHAIVNRQTWTHV
jgi:hypothetical protein